MATTVRRSLGYRRYLLSLQYHGSSFLGFSIQNGQENTILPDGTDLRGYHSVQGRLVQALQDLTQGSYENVQVSSRTDRGVHALKNTCHVDIQGDNKLTTCNILRGLNYHLAQQNVGRGSSSSSLTLTGSRNKRPTIGSYTTLGNNDWVRNDPMSELRVLAVKQAPEQMINPWHDTDNPDKDVSKQPATVDWNARFSATQRTYMYRIVHSVTNHNVDWAAPFEWDRSWRITDKQQPLDIAAMVRAAQHLQGTHDFSSFRGSGCKRQSPVITLNKVEIQSQPYGPAIMWGSAAGGGMLGLGPSEETDDPSCQLVTILFQGNSFVYRQVRNMVACLVDVGRGRLSDAAVADMLQARNRSRALGMAPAHGLYLVDVQHGDFII